MHLMSGWNAGFCPEIMGSEEARETLPHTLLLLVSVTLVIYTLFNLIFSNISAVSFFLLWIIFSSNLNFLQLFSEFAPQKCAFLRKWNGNTLQ